MRAIFEKLLSEAQISPLLLSDLAGLESYISESYTNRSFIELLQNADDAYSTKFYVGNLDNYLIVANDGREFNSNDIESICRSASSSKVRGATIGYRGIGFKSVVSFSHEVHILSGEFEVTFSKELTKNLIPSAAKVPLIRIPHPIRQEVKSVLIHKITSLRNKGYKTFFIFSGVDIEQISHEYLHFQRTALLFLNNVIELDLDLSEKVNIHVSTTSVNADYKISRISIQGDTTEWKVFSNDNCNIAFLIRNGRVVRMSKYEALIHAFLPTEDSSGLGVIINGDFSSDPSRRHLICDDTTSAIIKSIAELYSKIFKDNLYNGSIESTDIILALLPYFDVRLVHLSKNHFEKQLTNNIKSLLGTECSNINLSPSWFNIGDYCSILNNLGYPFINDNCLRIPGIDVFLKFLGAKTDNAIGILNKLNNMEISISGYAEIVSASIRQILLNNKVEKFVTENIFFSGGTLTSLIDINNNEKSIDDSFIQLLKDKGITDNDLLICFKKLALNKLIRQNDTVEQNTLTNNIVGSLSKLNKSIPTETYQAVFDTQSVQDASDRTSITEYYSELTESNNTVIKNQTHWFNSLSHMSSYSNVEMAPKKWRSAEENALIILNMNGFKLKDVSCQNKGYDLEGIDPDGEDIYIEVKSLDFKGQKFRMTNNEFAVAQYKKDKYYLALISQKQNSIDIGLIKNPINNLKMIRQCVQWVWECSEYSCAQINFKL